MDNRVSVFWYDIDGNQYREKYLAPIEECRDAIARLKSGPATYLDIVRSIKVVDASNCLIVEMVKTDDGWHQQLPCT